MRQPRIVERKLGRERAWGQYESGRAVLEIDPRMRSNKRLEIVLHEALHHQHPDMSETAVSKTARVLARVLWQDRYRRVER